MWDCIRGMLSKMRNHRNSVLPFCHQLNSISKFISKISEYRLSDRQESKVHRLKLFIMNRNVLVTNRQEFSVCRWMKKSKQNSFAFDYYCWLLLINMLLNVCAINFVQHCSLLTVHCLLDWARTYIWVRNPKFNESWNWKNVEHELN